MSISNIFISTGTKGISGHLMKASSKRRRTKQQIKEEQKLEEMKQREIAKKLAAFDELEAKASQV